MLYSMSVELLAFVDFFIFIFFLVRDTNKLFDMFFFCVNKEDLLDISHKKV